MFKFKNKYLNYVADFVYLFAMVEVLMFLFYRGAFSSIKNWGYGSIYGMLNAFIMFKGNRSIGEFLDRHISWLQSPLKHVAAILVLGATFTVVVTSVLNVIFFIFVFNVPVKDFYVANLHSLSIPIVIYLVASLISYLLVFFFKWRTLALEQEKQKHEALRLRFEALRNHVNPHFLFNSLSSLAQLIRTDPDKAIEFTNNLSDTYRYILETKDKDLIPLSEEMKLANAYLHLQELRYGSLIAVRNRIDDGEQGLVIPVSVQMLLENVFKHNEISRNKTVTIELWIENDHLVIRNNLNPRQSADNREPSGLANIRHRYEYLSHKPCVILDDKAFFTVKIPLIYKYRNN